MYIEPDRIERAIVVGLVLPFQDRATVNEYLDELELLADTAGAEVVERVTQDRSRMDPAFMLGKGKIQQVAEMAKYLDADLIIFDDDLTVSQIRNIENLCFNKKILDRSGLILDIFAKHARTREARTQVELAQLNYMLPRLTRQWSHLSRQAGGIGLRGPGETQLEVDRRLVRKRISLLEKELQKIGKQRNNRRSHRDNVFKAALVGYTNVGKSTIMNAFTDADVLVEDRLFATLDSTVRALELSDHRKVLLIDTVGFIRKLPHHLVASFKSTLEEARDADLLLHVIDVSNPAFHDQMAAVDTVLRDLSLNEKPVLLVFNKIDLIEDTSLLSELKLTYKNAVFISAGKGVFLQDFAEKIREFIDHQTKTMQVKIPMHQTKLISQLHELAEIHSVEYDEESAIIELSSNPANIGRIETLLGYRKEKIEY